MIKKIPRPAIAKFFKRYYTLYKKIWQTRQEANPSKKANQAKLSLYKTLNLRPPRLKEAASSCKLKSIV
ncbi:hypothetical protein DB41_HE00030 [Neochlamydia sp. TUME1]|nr:hypothetical protein DB41_HE00030 [Neochlamydia sp. TUME1]